MGTFIDKVMRWAVCGNFLVYETNANEPQNGGLIHLVNLKENNRTAYVKIPL